MKFQSAIDNYHDLVGPKNVVINLTRKTACNFIIIHLVLANANEEVCKNLQHLMMD